MTESLNELKETAIASLDKAIATFSNAHLSEDEADGWTSDLVALFADGMAACRWLLAQGFSSPDNTQVCTFESVVLSGPSRLPPFVLHLRRPRGAQYAGLGRGRTGTLGALLGWFLDSCEG